MRGFFFGFLGEVGQSALCFLVGRSSKFLQLFAGIQSCRGNLFILIVIIIGYLPFDFLMVLNYYYHSIAITKIVFWVAKNFRFFLCSIWFSVSGIVSVLINWVCWVRGNFSGGPGRVYVSCVSPLVECWAGTSIFGHCGGVDGGTVRIFFWLCRGGYGTGEMVRGVVCFFLSFLQFAVSCLGGWISAVGTLCYIYLLVVTLWYF